MCIVHLLFFVCDAFDLGDGLEWDDDCEGLIRTIAREKEWEDHQAQNDAVQWGTLTPGAGWEETPPASLVFQDGIPQFGPWGLMAEQVAQGGTWPTEEELHAERERLRLGGHVPIEVSVEVYSSIGELTGERTACRCS
jgi:hypothetical protein